MSTPQASTAMEMEQRDLSGYAPALPFIKVPEDSPFKLAPLQHRQLAQHHHASPDPRDRGQTSIYTIMPVDAFSSACKAQRERINEAIKDHTDKPEEIDNCRLGDKLIFAKASLTMAQANILQNHPDVSAIVTELYGITSATNMLVKIAVVSDIPGPLIEYF